MEDWKQRTTLLLGAEKSARLAKANILVAGVGGVGSYAAELLCRAGVGKMTLVDADIVQPSNINRQLPALQTTVGRGKTDVIAERFRQINPDIDLILLPVFLNPENIPPLLNSKSYDFIVDAIDTLAPKCALISEALARNIPIISSMGAGAKSDITQIRYTDIWKTYHCGLSKAVRQGLRKKGITDKVPVVFSAEQPCLEAVIPTEGEAGKKSTAGTVSYMPAAFGCYLAQYVISAL